MDPSRNESSLDCGNAHFYDGTYIGKLYAKTRGVGDPGHGLDTSSPYTLFRDGNSSVLLYSAEVLGDVVVRPSTVVILPSDPRGVWETPF